MCVRSRSRGLRSPPPWVVWRAHPARSRYWALVEPFHVVHAPPRVLPRSLAPSGVLGGGRSGAGSPLPGLALCALCGAGSVAFVCRGAGLVVGGGGGPCAVPPVCAAGGASRAGGSLYLVPSLCLPWAGNKAGVTGVLLVRGGVVPIPLWFELARLLWARSVLRPGALARARLFPTVPVGAGGWGGGAGRFPAPLSGGGRGNHPPCLGGWGPAPLRLAGRWGGGSRAAASLLPLRGGGPWFPTLAFLLLLAHSPLACEFRRGRRAGPGGGRDEGQPVDRSPGGPSRPEPPPSALPEWAMVMGGVMGGAASILFRRAAVRRPQAWSARRSSTLVCARPSAATPRGSSRLGALGRAVCRSSRTPPSPRRGPFWGRGASPRLWGGRWSLLLPSSLGGGGGGGGRGAAPPLPAPPPRQGFGLPSVVSGVPPQGITRAVGVAGRPQASGAARSAANGSVRRGGGGGEGGATPTPWFAPPPSPGRPLREPLRLRRPRRHQSAVGRQRAGRERAGSSPGALAASALPPHPGCSGLFGGGAGPPSPRSASVCSWTFGGGGGGVEGAF